MNGTGLFEKAKLATDKYNNEVDKENYELSKVTNEMNNITGGTRNNSSKIKSLINVDDTTYDKTNNGYIFTTSGTINGVINLAESIEDYDYIIFELDNYYENCYTYPGTYEVSVDQIKYNNTDTWDASKSILVTYHCGTDYNRIAGWFKDGKTFRIENGHHSNSVFTKLRITDIKGIKY